ncbi:MAG: [Fe-Fe] hydrogenase large subunit C-terminal domain-containing protein [Bacteroidales bacterium]|nr:[Fe-Fe] hydrogenase large subunit C-terminal domain-containing protein [Bacteroidales bacterium]
MQTILIDHNKCSKSYACIRVCPVKAISLRTKDGMPVVNHSRCIGCGSCLDVCASDAVSHYSDLDMVVEMLQSDHKVAAIVDPTISGEFPDITDYRKFVEMIRKLGFGFVNEVAFGVDLIAQKYRELLSDFKGKYYLLASCPSLVSYVEKFFPELIDNLTPMVNPMTAMAKVVRATYGEDLKVVFIGPCLSAKYDAQLPEDTGKVDAVLTFKELRDLFDRFKIKESKVEYSDFDPPIGYLGSLYPISNGILQAAGIDESMLKGKVITVEEKNPMMDAVDEFNRHPESLKRHFNIFYHAGCLTGPGTTDKSNQFLRRSLVKDYVNKRLKKFDKKQWEKEMERYTGLDLRRSFVKDDQRLPEPGNEAVEEIMKSLGKRIEETASCNACGFRSCRDFAVSVSQGLSRPEMCLNYSVNSKQEYIKTLKINNEKLKKQQEQLLEQEKTLRDDYQKIKQRAETTSSLFKNLPSAAVIVDEKLKVIESNDSFIKVLGEDAEMINEVIPGLVGADLKTLLPFNIYNLFSYVLENNENITGKDVTHNDRLLNVSIYSLKPNKIVGGVLRDMYVAEVRQEEIINRVGEVIDENLKMVQKIAFSLGEGASTTERMLNSIIETYRKTGKK